MSIPNDDKIEKAIAKIARRILENEGRALFGLPPTTPEELFTAADPAANNLAPVYTTGSASGPSLDWEKLLKMSADANKAHLEYGLGWDKKVWYRAVEFAPQTDQAGEPIFLFLKDYGYYILHPFNVIIFRNLLAQAGYELLPMPIEADCAPGYKSPFIYQRDWPIMTHPALKPEWLGWDGKPMTLPVTKEEFHAALRAGLEAEAGDALVRLYDTLVASGEPLLEAYQHALEALVFKGKKPGNE